MDSEIPKTQTVALIHEQGGQVHFKDDYPVPTPGHNEVLAKVLYTGVCQSGQHQLSSQLSKTKETGKPKQTSTPKTAPPPAQPATP